MELVRPYVPPKGQFVEIGAVKRIRDGVSYARNFGEPVQIVSEAGFGKTTALYYLAEELGGAYCQVGHAQKSVPDMYRLLLSGFKIWHDANYSRDLYNRLIAALDRRSFGEQDEARRLLIVDEVQTLEATALRELLNIQETCNLALVISGNGERLAQRKVDHAAWKQIDSRIGMKVSLPPLSRQDCINIGTSFSVEGMDAYEAVINFGTRTTPRLLCRLLREANALTGGTGAIRLQHIESVVKAKGRLEDLRLLRPEPA